MCKAPSIIAVADSPAGSVPEMLVRFEELLRLRHQSASTIDARLRAVRMFFEYLDRFGVTDARAVTRQHVRDYAAWLLDSGRHAMATVHVRLIGLRRFFEHLEATDAILINPCQGVRLPKLPDRLPRTVLSAQEARKVLAMPDCRSPKGIRDRAILELFYSTGLRVSEMAALSVDDVDLGNGLVRVNQGKGGRDRVVPMGSVAGQSLSEYLEQVRSKWTANNPDQGALWLASIKPHQPIGVLLLQLMVREYGKAAGLNKRLTPHVWRHTCATHLVARGGNISYVQRLLGHRRLDTTQIYMRVAIPEIQATYRRCGPKPAGQAPSFPTTIIPWPAGNRDESQGS